MSEGQTRPPQPTALDVDPEPIPDKLRDRDQWLCWRYKWATDRNEWTKMPIDPSTGRAGSSTDPDTWTSFGQALAYHERSDTNTDGLGFALHENDLFVGVDLDDCQDPDTGDREAWASDLLDDVLTYAEVSPSGTGLRLFGFGILPAGGNRADVDGADGHLEVYDSGRYLTVTGHTIDGTPNDVRQVNDDIGAVHAEHIASGDEPEKPPTAAANGGVEAVPPNANPRGNAGNIDLNDDELLDRAMNAKNGDYFTDLWEGRWKKHTSRWETSGNQGQSEADLALCSMLAFWTDRDRARIDRLFRRSGLCRDKWTGREDYRQRTIHTALDGVSDVYDPDRDNTGDVSTALPDAPTAPDDVASADADGRDGSDPDAGVDHGDDVDGDTRGVTLCPAEVMAWAGLGEDDDLSDLNDRQKAASVWELLKHSDRYHVRVRRDNGSLWAYEGGVWTSTGERTLRHAARQALWSMNYGANVLEELKAQARADPTVEVEADDVGLDPGYLAVENGLIDLDDAAGAGDDALRDLRPDDYALTRLPVQYDPDTDFERWADHVEEWAEDDRADALQEYVGYCLHVGEIPIHRALLLVGTGANGKGTFLSVVRSLLGRENTSSIELQTLANERDAVADFYGSLANIDDDLSARKLGQGLGMFKKLVGGDRVRARHLYEDGFEFDATGKHLYAANEVPDVNVPDDDEAFWRRWLLVEFPNHYPPSERDPSLRDELTTDDVLSGVLNWAIDGRKRLLDQGHFTNEDHYAQGKRERWQAWGESVDQFISECVDRDPDADRLTTKDAHRRYAAWCRANGLDPVGQRKFTNTLMQEDVGYGRYRFDRAADRGYTALGLADDVPDLDDTPERADDPPVDHADDGDDDTRQDSLV